MMVGAISVECFHCVDFRVVNSTKATGEYLKSVAGTICPLCGTRTETFMLVVDSEDYRKIGDGVGTWNRGEEPAAGFSGFTDRADSGPRGTSAAAERLRGQLREQADRRRKATCQAITDFAAAGVALSVGREAKAAGQLAEARRAFEACAGTGKPEAFAAGFHLGELAEADRDLAAAARWYRLAAGTADASLRAAATLYLGTVLRTSGDLDGATAAFQRCVDCGVAPMQGMAAFRLGAARHDRNDREGAREAYEFTLDLDDELSSPDAAMNLGALEEENGDWNRARSLWEYAHERGQAETSLLAAFNLGRYWQHQGNNRKARKFFKVAVRSEDPSVAARAKAYLSPGGR
ncbi:tetratricopeptide repeat protein [Amycolatopsis sp. cmx-4-61]|uniref:tetratricopeptide repeat protein n=1 Tax=Amycolatopsis sp. cmx-4-61 TaxID=2790937 RepID=UPI00397A2D34